MHRIRSKGFALPTVLIASVVLLTILAVSVTATAAVRTSLKTQYYSQLAQAAGEAGVAYAKACLAENNNEPTWSDANPLQPNTDCSGNDLLDPQVQALIVAGGGGGASRHGGGGGGGGIRYNGSIAVSATSYSIVVGAGGSGTPNGSGSSLNLATNGGNSSAFGLTATGGGAGRGNTTGNSGGSGGGGGGTTTTGGAGTAGQGFAGGSGAYSTYYMGGGGGGAGGVGTAASYPSNIEPAGGPGVAYSIGGTVTTYSAGGGGGSYNINTAATAGAPNTGGGGGGAGGESNGGAVGGSGVVIIAYPNSGGIVATGGNEVYIAGSYKVHKFTSSGTFQVTQAANSSCPNDTRCFVMENGNVRSSFSVGMPTVDGDGKAVTIPNNGYVEITRSSNGSVWRTYTQPTVQSAVVPDLCSGQASSSLGWNNAYVVTDNLSTSGVNDSAPIALNATNEVYPGPHYFRKDFSVVTSGDFVLTSVAGATQEIYVDGVRVVNPTTTTAVRTIALEVGCHTVEARLYNGSLVPNGSELRLSLRAEGASTSVAKTDSTWRATAGNLVDHGKNDYYTVPAGWGVVRDVTYGAAYTATFTSQGGDPYARFISSVHSNSGGSYPFAQYVLLRDSRTVTVSTPTEVNVTSLCDDACNVYLNGDLIQSNTWANVVTSTITLPEGTHQFTARLYNGGVAVNPSGFAMTVKQTSDNAILTRTDNRWLASSSWTASPPSYSSYSADYVPTPMEMNLPVLAQVLVVGAGGGGGINGGGGGGGGGVIYDDAYTLSTGSTSVTIGSGGIGATNYSTTGTNGGNSSLGSLIAIGGGGGASRDGGPGGQVGGSGGGGGGATGSPRHIGGAGTAGQGSLGGNGTTPDPGCPAAGGGAGGAGGFGGGASNSQGGTGGTGYISYISGTRVIYGAGGAGGPTCPGSYGIADQNAGAGNGVNGTANTGGGGAGKHQAANGNGGSGVVIIRYPTGLVTATGGTITTSGGYTIHRFTSSGTFTVTSIN